MIFRDFQPMIASEEPVCMYIFRQNPVFTSLHKISRSCCTALDAGCQNWIFAGRNKCRSVLLKHSLARNLEKPVMSLHGTEWRDRGYGLSRITTIFTILRIGFSETRKWMQNEILRHLYIYIFGFFRRFVHLWLQSLHTG